jgi:hypothetical protein
LIVGHTDGLFVATRAASSIPLRAGQNRTAFLVSHTSNGSRQLFWVASLTVTIDAARRAAMNAHVSASMI